MPTNARVSEIMGNLCKMNNMPNTDVYMLDMSKRKIDLWILWYSGPTPHSAFWGVLTLQPNCMYHGELALNTVYDKICCRNETMVDMNDTSMGP